MSDTPEFDCPHVTGPGEEREHAIVTTRTIPWSDKSPPRTEAATHVMCADCFEKVGIMLRLGLRMVPRTPHRP